ncbi:transport permease protein [Alsobacter metallidurans]|uniref:Transport permease protein n=1 Tax=Alsobacter metallidurans TaxID=340221 RepID=A0A917I4A5_9HYPH|nr:ABC transporter permease [Alsobacter metallidurans]GGH13137.1 transport permease protein [Alsobacter metallidurans]
MTGSHSGVLAHASLALAAILRREITKFLRQTGRLVSAVVRPTLWLVVFSAGFQNVLGVSITPPYENYITYDVYMAPGLIGMVLLFQGMQSSLALVFDREVGTLRLLLTAPLPRWYLLLCKLAAGTLLGVAQAYAFLLVALAFGVDLPRWGWISVLPALALGGFSLAALGLLLSVYVRRLENFAGTMNFVIFPAFFFSTALYPLWKLRESGSEWIAWAARVNPFTHVVEMIRFALYGQFSALSTGLTLLFGVLAFGLAVRGYDPQSGVLGRAPRDE